MAIKVEKDENESSGSLIYRFNRKLQQSGILKEFKNRRFRTRPTNRNQRRASALRKAAKKSTIEKARKLGKL